MSKPAALALVGSGFVAAVVHITCCMEQGVGADTAAAPAAGAKKAAAVLAGGTKAGLAAGGGEAKKAAAARAGGMKAGRASGGGGEAPTAAGRTPARGRPAAAPRAVDDDSSGDEYTQTTGDARGQSGRRGSSGIILPEHLATIEAHGASPPPAARPRVPNSRAPRRAILRSGRWRQRPRGLRHTVPLPVASKTPARRGRRGRELRRFCVSVPLSLAAENRHHKDPAGGAWGRRPAVPRR